MRYWLVIGPSMLVEDSTHANCREVVPSERWGMCVMGVVRCS